MTAAGHTAPDSPASQATPAPAQAAWTVVPLNRRLAPYGQAWDRLLSRMPFQHPMLDSRFVDALLRHFGDGTEHLCWQGTADEPDAMCILHRLGRFGWQTFLPSQAQVGPQLLGPDAALPALVQTLPGRAWYVDWLCVDPQVNPRAGYPGPQRSLHAKTINVRLSGSFEVYWEQRSKSLRHNLRRWQHRSRGSGDELRHLVITAPVDVVDAVKRYAQLEAKGWKGQLGTAVAPGNRQEAFYTQLLADLAHQGRSEVHEMWLGRRLLASRLLIHTDHAVAILKTSYDEEFNLQAPGRQQLAEVIASCFDRHAGKRLEFCTNANPDQFAWATGSRFVEHWTTPRNRLIGGLLQTLQVGRGLFSSGRAGPAPSDWTVDIHRQLDELPADTVELLNLQARQDLQFSHPWLANLARTVFPDNSGIRIYVLRGAGQPLAVLPMLLKARGWGQELHALGNFYTSLYSPALSFRLQPAGLAVMLDAIRASVPRLRAIHLAPMDPDASGFKVLKAALQGRGFACFDYFCFGNWSLHGIRNWNDFMASRSSQMRSNIRRAAQRLNKEGGHVEILTDAADLERGLQAYLRVYASSWKVPEPFPQFLPAFAQLCARQGWLRLGIAWLGEVPVAAQLWTVSRGKASIFKVAYDEAYRSLSPGTALSAALMEHVMDKDHVEVVDFLTGDDEYKSRWMNLRQERWGLVAYNMHGFFGIMDGLLESLKRFARIWRDRGRKFKAATPPPAQTPEV